MHIFFIVVSEWAKASKVPKDIKKGPQIKPNRMRITSKIPTTEEISTIKHKKKVTDSNLVLNYVQCFK